MSTADTSLCQITIDIKHTAHCTHCTPHSTLCLLHISRIQRFCLVERVCWSKNSSPVRTPTLRTVYQPTRTRNQVNPTFAYAPTPTFAYAPTSSIPLFASSLTINNQALVETKVLLTRPNWESGLQHWLLSFKPSPLPRRSHHGRSSNDPMDHHLLAMGQ